MALRVAGVALLACLALLGFALATGSNTGETTVRVSATPVFPAIPWAQQRDDFEVLVRVEAPATVQTHAPIDLVAVLDVSESMNAGAAPSRLDLLKKAMKFVISKLGDSDRLAIVAFNDHVVEGHSTELLRLSGHGRCHAKRVIDEIEAGGRTALRPALERAVRVLCRWEQRWSKSAKRRPSGHQVTKCLELAQSCLHKDPNRRPFVWDIINELNNLDNDD